MDVGVAIDTAAPESGTDAAAKRPWRSNRWNRSAMARRLVALLAQKRLPPFQHAGHDGSVRLVTEGAVLGDRLVVPYERTTLFGVAPETSTVDRIAGHKAGPGGPVRVMAGGTGNFSFPDGMTRRLTHLSPLLAVAGYADFCLFRLP